MKKNILPLLIAIISIAVTFPAHSQVITKYGDNVSTLDGIIKAYYGVVSVKKGEKVSYERDSLLHISMEYHKLADPSLSKNGFDEREIARRVEKFGSIYHVWSTYESRNTADGPVTERGINSIELFNDGTRFWILAWFYDGERKDNPIPAEYLK